MRTITKEHAAELLDLTSDYSDAQNYPNAHAARWDLAKWLDGQPGSMVWTCAAIDYLEDMLAAKVTP